MNDCDPIGSGIVTMPDGADVQCSPPPGLDIVILCSAANLSKEARNHESQPSPPIHARASPFSMKTFEFDTSCVTFKI